MEGPCSTGASLSSTCAPPQPHSPIFLVLLPSSHIVTSSFPIHQSLSPPWTLQQRLNPAKSLSKKSHPLSFLRINPLLCTGIMSVILDGGSILLCHSSLCGEACLYFCSCVEFISLFHIRAVSFSPHVQSRVTLPLSSTCLGSGRGGNFVNVRLDFPLSIFSSDSDSRSAGQLARARRIRSSLRFCQLWAIFSVVKHQYRIRFRLSNYHYTISRAILSVGEAPQLRRSKIDQNHFGFLRCSAFFHSTNPREIPPPSFNSSLNSETARITQRSGIVVSQLGQSPSRRNSPSLDQFYVRA